MDTGNMETQDFVFGKISKGHNQLHVYFRWEVISNFIKQHITDSNKNAKDVLAKAKDLQKNGLYKYTVQYNTLLLPVYVLFVC